MKTIFMGSIVLFVLCNANSYSAFGENMLIVEILHIGLVSRIIRGLDSVLLYVAKVTKSYYSMETMRNQFSMENRALRHKVLSDSALAHFTIMILHRSQNFQNTT